MAARNPSGTGRLRLLAAILLIGGPILALILRSWGVGSFVVGLGAILLGIRLVKAFNTTFSGTLVEGEVAGQPLDVFIAGDDEAKETVAQLVRDGSLRAIDIDPLERARQLEGLGFLGITLQQPLGLNFRSARKLIT